MMLTACLFPFTVFGIGFILNAVAIAYHSLAAIPFGTMVSGPPPLPPFSPVYKLRLDHVHVWSFFYDCCMLSPSG